MSREIKFRAWNSLVKKMLHFGNPLGIMDNEDRHGMFLESLEGKMYCGGNYVLMQFTGLKDKNGKEIYEGDIMRNVMNGRIATVQWHGTMAGFVLSNLKEKSQATREWGELFRAYDKYEVVGNVYENTELMEVPNERN